jgi:ubiquinone/menaquinone biosynthesis C-methylase UbiE
LYGPNGPAGAPANGRTMQFGTEDAANVRAQIAYLDNASRTSAQAKEATFVAQRIGEGMRVLDLGCGTGDDVRDIARLVGPGGRVDGVDANGEMIAEARSRGVPENAAFAVAGAASLPFANGAFDAVRAERVFQHIADPQAAGNELHRVLTQRGSVLLLDQDWESLVVAGAERSVTRRIVRAFVDRLANGWAGREGRGILRRAGFSHASSAPFVATPPLPLAFETVLQPAIEAALNDGSIDAEGAKRWLQSLLEADLRGEFFCAVLVVVTLGSNAGGETTESA